MTLEEKSRPDVECGCPEEKVMGGQEMDWSWNIWEYWSELGRSITERGESSNTAHTHTSDFSYQTGLNDPLHGTFITASWQIIKFSWWLTSIDQMKAVFRWSQQLLHWSSSALQWEIAEYKIVTCPDFVTIIVCYSHTCHHLTYIWSLINKYWKLEFWTCWS